ncbi:CREB3 regulatory factor-like [Liolophura sinensis]|uniref:CREB3 regulatory factor-like n=1 Tax=Liolophura sinensis TaxID=3198878 RepID=UPI003158689F
MTVSQTTASVRPMMMDTALSGQCEMYEQPISMDHTLPSESFVQELSYAPSPDSLYMYDQDRQTESFMNTCGPQDMSVLSGCFLPGEQQELKQQLENDIMASSVGTGLQAVSMTEFCDMNWDDKDIEFVNMEDVFQDRTDASQGPTLTQLNSFVDDKQLPKSRLSKSASSSAAASTSEDWVLGSMALEDWESKENTSCTTMSTTVPRFSTLSTSTNWTENSQQQTPSTSDDSYPTRPMHTFATLSTVKEEPGQRECVHSQMRRYQKLLDRRVPAHETSLHKLLLQGRIPIKTENPSISPPVSPSKRTVTASLSKSQAPGEQSSHSVDQKWEEIKQFLHASADSSLRIKREQSDSSSQETKDYGSDDSDGDEEWDCHSDQDSSDSENSLITSPGSSKSKEKQYFWQYNVQSKGPKGKKLCLSLDTVDPHVLHNFEDPVFDPEYRVPGITHGGKARRGDGNNVYPNPKKLCQIGNELKKLNKLINDYGPLNDLPSAVRAKSRKEKNKLASRACRLKKKAQHEANKVKLMGLEQEHSHLMEVLSLMKAEIVKRVNSAEDDDKDSLTTKLENYIQTRLKMMIAGNTTEFVNNVIKQVNCGDLKGALNML